MSWKSADTAGAGGRWARGWRAAEPSGSAPAEPWTHSYLPREEPAEPPAKHNTNSWSHHKPCTETSSPASPHKCIRTYTCSQKLATWAPKIKWAVRLICSIWTKVGSVLTSLQRFSRSAPEKRCVCDARSSRLTLESRGIFCVWSRRMASRA